MSGNGDRAAAERRDKAQARFVLANMILDLVRTLRLKVGHHLTEQWLARELNVSRTPVRAALGLLAERRIVEARRRQGYFLLTAWNELDPGHEIEVPATAEQAFYAALLRDRVAGTVADSITQSELSRRYGINRLLLLRTLGRMADEGLVIRNTGQGWTFLPTLSSSTALRNSYDFRLTVEPAALLLPGFRADKLALRRLRADHDYALSRSGAAAMSDSALFELDASFHETLAAWSDNPFFVQGIQQQNRLRRLLEYQGYTNRRRVRDWVLEHISVLDAVEAGDMAAAAARLRHHLTNAIAASPAPAGPRASGTAVQAPGPRTAKVRDTGHDDPAQAIATQDRAG